MGRRQKYRYRHHWYPAVIDAVMVYRYKSPVKPREVEVWRAIREALDETRAGESGEERVKVIEMVMINKTHTISGAAAAIPVSVRTAKRWKYDFINMVGSKIGY